MIILPDRNIPRAKILMPVPDKQWRESSQTIKRDMFDNLVVQTRFRIRAKTHDGVVLWRGFFDDRADFDAFLWAVFIGSLPQERPLWDLPTPMWPGLDPGLVYDFATVTFLTSSSSTSPYTSPLDWNNNNNTIECVGSGGSGGAVQNTAGSRKASGGGAGAYVKISNFSFATPGTTTADFSVSGGGSARTFSAGANGASGGIPGSDTIWNSAIFPTTGNAAGAAGGGAGASGTTGTISGGAGATLVYPSSGATASYSGGNGGAISTGTYYSATGGGAPGVTGTGGNGVSATAAAQGTDGGAATGDSGGTAGTGSTSGNGGAGGNGTFWDSTHGIGGGGGATYRSAISTTTTAGSGGAYGSGGGAAVLLNGTGSFKVQSGAGGDGIIVVTYSTGSAFPNLAMIGM